MAAEKLTDWCLDLGVQMDRVDEQRVGNGLSRIPDPETNVSESLAKTLATVPGHQYQRLSVHPLGHAIRQRGSALSHSISRHEQGVDDSVARHVNARIRNAFGQQSLARTLC